MTIEDSGPQSILTLQRPDIWERGLALATGLTGYTYAPKLPLPDGTLYACGGGGPSVPVSIQDFEHEIKISEGEIQDLEERLEDEEDGDTKEYLEGEIRWWKEQLKKEKGQLKKKKGLSAAPTVNVPEGAMEWLLHEVGHYVASTPAERLMVNYGVGSDLVGHNADREWQAWAFADMVLSPFGTSRLFTPRSQQDGIHEIAGPIPHQAVRHAELQVEGLGIDVGQWQALYGEWARLDVHEVPSA